MLLPAQTTSCLADILSEDLPRRGLLTRAAAAAAARTWLAMLDLGGRPRLFFGASTGACTDCTCGALQSRPCVHAQVSRFWMPYRAIGMCLNISLLLHYYETGCAYSQPTVGDYLRVHVGDSRKRLST